MLPLQHPQQLRHSMHKPCIPSWIAGQSLCANMHADSASLS